MQMTSLAGRAVGRVVLTGVVAMASACGASQSAINLARASARPAAIAPDAETSSDYEVFADWTAAAAWIDAFEAEQAQSRGSAPFVALPHDDPRYARFADGFHRMWEAFKVVYPTETAGMPEPFAVISSDASPDGYVHYDRATGQIPWLVEVTQGVFDQPFGEEGLLGFVAHELGHAVFKHGLPTAVQASAFYRQAAGAELLGFQQADDASARAVAEPWLTESLLVGNLHEPEQRGIPFSTYGLPAYVSMLEFLQAHYLSGSSEPSCALANTEIDAFRAVIRAKRRILDWAAPLTAEDRVALAGHAQAFIDAVGSCPVSPAANLSERLREQYGDDYADKLRLLGGDALVAQIAQDESVFASASNAFLGLVAVSLVHQESMWQTDSVADWSSIRHFNVEEEADDISSRVMASLGYTTGVGLFFLDFMPADQRQECEGYLAAGRVPPYGPLNDPHHAPCYRVYHAQRVIALAHQ
jgi:Zn-dependent protease with chaperone function